MKKLFVILMSICCLGVAAQESANAKQAKRIFNQTYNMIYGPEGASFHYDINILKIYSSDGSGWFKGNKSMSTTRKSLIWDNGDIKYIYRKGKDIVEIHDPKVNKKDQLLQKFKFEPDDFTYAIADDPEGLLITLKAKKGAKTSMKEIRALVAKKTYIPKRLRIKVSFFWATITLTDFKAGGIDDKTFVFPKEEYKHCKFIDER